jgi:hypothetical protein
LLEDRVVPAVFNVNSTADILNPPSGTVTLRSAIQQANATPGGNTINLTLAGTYRITLAGTAGETDNAAGEFAILPAGGNLSIINTSGGLVTVDAGGLNRVFDINPANTNNPATKITVTMQGFTITGGRATSTANPDGPDASGGGIRDQGNASLTLTNMVVTGNSATADGGGVSMENPAVSTPWTLTVNNSTISNNSAGDAGGGLETDGSGTVLVNTSNITGNISVNQGAGIWIDAIQVGVVFQGANLTVTDSDITANRANTAGAVGGGIGNAGNGTVTITRSTLASNFSGGTGGGFGDENAQGTLVVLNSTFANNSAGASGGGVAAGGFTTTINDATVTGNVSQTTGGGLSLTSATTTLNNTIVAENQSNNGGMNFAGTAPDISAAVTTGSGNFIGIGDAALTGITNGTNSNQVGTTTAPLNPLLGPLQNNGGPATGATGSTQPLLTRAPLAGSPVINAGVNAAVPPGTTTDQRGALRIIGGRVDIGAVEFVPPQITGTASPAAFPVGANLSGFTPIVNLQNNGATVRIANPFPLFTGEIRRAGGDLNADGTPDIVWAAGPGGGPEVKVFDGATGAVLADFFAFAPNFTGGVFVAAADVNGDGRLDLIVSAGAGGGPEVKVIDGTKLTQVQSNGVIANTALLADFFAFDPGFTGGVTVAGGDFNGDGKADVVVGAGPGSIGPVVRVLNATKLTQLQANGQISAASSLADFFAYAPSFTGGVFVAVGDFNGDGRPDLITGAGAGGGPVVRVLDGTKLNSVQSNGQISNASSLADFFAYAQGFGGGVRVDAVDVNGDGKADVVTGAGPGGGPQVNVFRATDLFVLDSFFAQPATFTGGVYV